MSSDSSTHDQMTVSLWSKYSVFKMRFQFFAKGPCSRFDIQADRIRWNGLFCRIILIRPGMNNSQSTFCFLFWERPALNFSCYVRRLLPCWQRHLPLESFEMCHKAAAQSPAMCSLWTAPTLFSYEVMLHSLFIRFSQLLAQYLFSKTVQNHGSSTAGDLENCFSTDGLFICFTCK